MPDKELARKEKLRIYRDVFYGSLFQKQKGSAKRVEKVYETGIYNHLKQIKVWNLSLDDLLHIDFANVDEQNKEILYENKNKLVRNYRNTIWDIWQEEFVNKIKRFIEPDDQIIELGCGYGRNLFVLKNNGFKNKMSGYDISNNAIDVAQQINRKFDMGMDFGVFDYTQKLKMDLKGKTVFTYASLEAVKYGLEKAIDNIIEAQPKQVIHFETIPQLLDNNFHKLMVSLNRYRKDYPTKLLNVLQQKNVSITHLETNDICTGILNPIMMVRYTL